MFTQIFRQPYFAALYLNSIAEAFQCKKVKFFMCLIKHHAMKTYREVNVQLHAFLTSTVNRVTCFTFRPHDPVERVLGTHWKGGWVYSTAYTDAVAANRNMRAYPKVSGLAAWSENCKW
jgi:hypothetical protein